jgi:glycosyltransferase involved in cell wall biosynthesis
MNESDIPVWVHTSAASPYRKHLFEKLAAVYPRARFFFTLHEGDEWLKYQAWTLSTKEWKIKATNLRLRIPVPRFAYAHLDYIWHLLFQPKGTVHLVGGVAGNGWLILLSCVLRRSYYVIWGDGGFPDTLGDKPFSIFKRFCIKHTAAGFNAGKLGLEYFKKWGLPPEKIYHAYFSHDMDAFKAFYMQQGEKSRKQIRNLIGAKETDFVVLCVARLLDWKRIEDLADALLIIDRDNPMAAKRIQWILIGDGEFCAYQEIVSKYQNIRFQYHKRIEYDEIKGWFCAADVFGFPSEGDIWGLVVNEALSLGLPVICTERIGSAELVKDGWNGYVTKVRAPGEIARAVIKMFLNPELVLQMRKNAISIWDVWNSEKAIKEFQRMVAAIRPLKS